MILYISAKRVFLGRHRFQPLRTHEETLEWANIVDAGEAREINGIVGKSLLFDVPNFDVVWNTLPEAMHLLDLGFVKGLSGRVFNSGTAAQTMLGYRRTSIAELSNLVRYVLKNPINISLLLAHNYVNIHFNCLDRNIRYPTDFPRRAREYDHASWKAHEWRQHGLFHLPIILPCLPREKNGEKSIYMAFTFLNRAVRLPDQEYVMIDQDMLTMAEEIIDDLYKICFGDTACTYNFHHTVTHLRHIRDKLGGPLTKLSAYPFEGSYSDMRRSFIPGTRT